MSFIPLLILLSQVGKTTTLALLSSGQVCLCTSTWHATGLAGMGASQHNLHHLKSPSLICLFYEHLYVLRNSAHNNIICSRMMEMHSHTRNTQDNFITNMEIAPALLLQKALPHCCFLTHTLQSPPLWLPSTLNLSFFLSWKYSDIAKSGVKWAPQAPFTCL